MLGIVGAVDNVERANQVRPLLRVKGRALIQLKDKTV